MVKNEIKPVEREESLESRLDILIIDNLEEFIQNIGSCIKNGIYGENTRDLYGKLSEKELKSSGIDFSLSYITARDKILEKPYDVFFLGNKLAEEREDNFENPNGTFFYNQDKQGYHLIPLIREKNPKGFIVGTSLYPSSYLRSFDSPDLALDKSALDLIPQISEIFYQIRRDERRSK